MVLTVDLGAAFACGALSWRFGLPLIHSPPASGDRLVLAVGVATIVGAAVASWVPVPPPVPRPQVDHADRDRSLRERFDLATEQIGNRNAPAVQLAGVASMASLASDWPIGCQNCIDVLCGYLRLPYEPGSAPPGERQVRLAIIEAIRSNLTGQSESDWQGSRFDFSGAVFDQGSLDGARFMEGSVSFLGCRFLDAGLSARSALFSNCRLDCSRVVIDGDSSLNFDSSTFDEAQTNFSEITMPSGLLSLQKTIWYAGFHDFHDMTLRGGRVLFDNAEFKPSQRLADGNRDSLLSFRRCKLEAGRLSFRNARFEYEFDAPSRKRHEPPLSDEDHPLWPRTLVFTDSQLTGATVDFSSAQFTRGNVWLTFNATGGSFLFRGAEFSSGGVSFGPSELHDCLLDFSYARFLGNEESLELSQNVPFCQRWMMPIKESIERGEWFRFSMMRYPVPSVDFSEAVLGKVQIEFECIDAYGGVIDFKEARFDGADVCFAHARFGGLVIVLWNTDYFTRSGQIRLDRYSQPIILTNKHHLTNNKLAIVRTDGEVGHDGTAEEINNLREITEWAIGISSTD